MKALQMISHRMLGPLPELLCAENGQKVQTAEDWQARRREIFKTAVELQYGTIPPDPEFLEIEPMYYNRHNIFICRVHTGRRSHPVSFTMRVHLPKNVSGERIPKTHYVGPSFPVIVTGDMAFLSSFLVVNPPIEQGIGYAIFDRCELAPDIYDENEPRRGALYEAYPEYTFGAVGAWAWGYSRCVDALLKLGMADPDKITFSGHSRGGKTAMLAGVLDERASIVNPHQTCAGACSCYRSVLEAFDDKGEIKPSETLEDIWERFAFWLGKGMGEYVGRAEELPFDSHFLKALVAPRVLYVSEATHDIWANPVGSYLTTEAAKEAFALLGAEKNLYWSYRDGGHVKSEYDMQLLVNLIRHHHFGEPLSADFYQLPFSL